MYCKKCGATISEATSFCPICNHQIRQEEITEDTKIASEENKAEQDASRFVFTPEKPVRKHMISRAVKIAVPTCALCLVCGAFVWTGITNKNGETGGLQVADDAVFSMAEIAQDSADERIVEAKSMAETIANANTEQEENTEADSEKETESDTEQTEIADSDEGAAQGTTGNTPSGGSSSNSTSDDEWYDTPDGSHLPPEADVILGEDTWPMKPIFSDMESFENEFWSRAETSCNKDSWLLPGEDTIWVSQAVYEQIVAAGNAFNIGCEESVTVIENYDSTNGYSGSGGFVCSQAFIQEGIASGEIKVQKGTLIFDTIPDPIIVETEKYFIEPFVYDKYKNAGRIHGEYIYQTGCNTGMDYRHDYQIWGCSYVERLD